MTTAVDVYWLHNPVTRVPVGPYTAQQLIEYARTGQVTTGHLTNRAGSPDWVPFAQLFPGVLPAAPAVSAMPAAPPVVMGWLICIAGPDKGTRAPVQTTEAVMGRGPQAQIVLRDADAAEQHLKITLSGTRLHFAVAEGHKVLLNGSAVSQGHCDEGDQLQIGDSVWVYDAPDAADWVFRKIAGGMSAMMGVGALEAFSFKTLLSDAFRKRSEEDIERHMMVGTPATTPAISTVPTFWPKPWLFYRTLVFFLVSFGVLAGTLYLFDNPKLIPALTMLGAFGMPLAVVVLFFELNVPQNISLYQCLRVLVLGGVISLALTHLGLFIPFPKWLGASSAGPVEEIAKLVALLVAARGPRGARYPWTLNGLLFGAAVGAGFGIFETAGYAMEAETKAGFAGLMLNTLLRGILAPGMHVAWTALVGAALWRVRAGRPFDVSMLLDFRFLRVLLLAVGAHMVWNSPVHLPLFGNNIIVTVVLWFALLSLVQEGLNEIREAKKAPSPSVPPPPPPEAGVAA